MSPHTNLHAPGTSLSGRIQIGHKSGFIYFYLFYYYLSVNIKPPRHRFGFSLAWGWQLKNLHNLKEGGIFFKSTFSNLLKDITAFILGILSLPLEIKEFISLLGVDDANLIL